MHDRLAPTDVSLASFIRHSPLPDWLETEVSAWFYNRSLPAALAHGLVPVSRNVRAVAGLPVGVSIPARPAAGRVL